MLSIAIVSHLPYLSLDIVFGYSSAPCVCRPKSVQKILLFLVLSTNIIYVYRYVLNNGSLYFTSIKSSGHSPDPGRYTCIAEVQEGLSTKVHRIATPEVTLRLAGKCFQHTPLKTVRTKLFFLLSWEPHCKHKLKNNCECTRTEFVVF